LDQQDICLGCGRSLAEITGWHQADEQQKLQIIATASARLAQLQQARLQSESALMPSGISLQTNLNNPD
jgi:predicted Fe-S protein YdhL (DUF1289 family)